MTHTPHRNREHGLKESGARALYTCPMHPEVVSDKPGMCPECGMSLVPSEGKKSSPGGPGNHDKHAGHHTADFLKKFWVVLVVTVPILAYSDLFEIAFGFSPVRFFGYEWVILALGSFIYFYGGWIFMTGAYRELKARLPGMMTLIALAITAAYAFSVFATIAGTGSTLFWELSTLIAVMLLGHWFEMKAVKNAKGALQELAKLLPDTALVIRDGKEISIPLTELKEGDMVLVKPGAKVPADGEVAEGRSDVNESIITGESKPVSKEKGSEVIAGSSNGDGALTIRVTKIGEDTFLSGVMRLVAEAESSKSRLQLLSDRAALWLTVIAVSAGSVTFGVWFFVGAGIVFSVERLVAVLVIACPHALGLAIPLVASISTTKAAQNGFLVKRRISLETARSVETVLFDKTGTLTKGDFEVAAILPASGILEEEVLKAAASLNAQSEHPLAEAMVDEAQKRSLALQAVTNFERVPGKGARGQVEGAEVVAGNASLFDKGQLTFDTASLAKEGKTIIYVSRAGSVLGAIALGDAIRPESREAVTALKAKGIRVAMITGDSEDVAKWVSEELGVEQYFAHVLPGEKADKVKKLQQTGGKVAFVGDGVNDAPALTQADLGIAIGAGTNVAIESAGIILVRNDPRDIPKIITLSKLTYGKMIQNLFWASGYNIVALPLAAGILFTRGIVLEPAVAAVFMSLSTVIVAINAMLLRRKAL